jgi:hypothetical protein
MSEDAKAGRESKGLARAEYEAEFAEDEALAPIDTNEILDLLGPSRDSKNRKMVLAFRTRIRHAERELEEAHDREVAYQAQNKQAIEHNFRLAAERDALAQIVDPAGERRDLVEELAKTRTLLDGARKQIAALEARRPIVPLVEEVPLTWWQRLWGRS